MWQKIKKFLKDCWGWIVIALCFIPVCIKLIIERRRADKELLDDYRDREERIAEGAERVESTVGDCETIIEDIGESEREATARIISAQDGIREADGHAERIQSAVDAIREILDKDKDA